tara:strand:- start:421 stop:888 length:468 start_codon:yes stop_codon:yes gene_type:complete
MGVLFSKKHDKKLDERLTLLEQVDKNNDMKITERELNKWWEDKMNSEKEKNKNLILELENSKKQIEDMKKIINNIDLSSNTIKQDNIKELSKIKIEEFVEKLISDEQLNINWLPDYVERQIYFNVFNIIMRLLTDILQDTSLELIGHKIKFNINV